MELSDNNINCIRFLPDIGELHYTQTGASLRITSIYITQPRAGHLTRIFPDLIRHLQKKGVRTITLASPYNLWAKFGFIQCPDGTWGTKI